MNGLEENKLGTRDIRTFNPTNKTVSFGSLTKDVLNIDPTTHPGRS